MSNAPMSSISPTSSLQAVPAEFQNPEFVRKVDENYVCLLCKKVLQMAMQTPCGHRFCQPCLINFLMTNDPRTCPYIEEDCELLSLRNKNIFDDYPTRKELLRLDVYCKNKGDGCKEVMKWKDLMVHYNEQCLFTKILCPNSEDGCTDLILRKNLEKHTKDKCNFRKVKCRYCQKEFSAFELEQHVEQTCTEILRKCPFECNSGQYKAKELKKHMETCPKRKESCRLSAFGCQFTGTREDLIQHEKESASDHVELMANLIGEMRLEREQLKNKLQSSVNEADILKNQVQTLTAELDTCQQKMAELNNKQNMSQVEIVNLQEAVSSIGTKLTVMDVNVTGIQETMRNYGDMPRGQARGGLPDNFSTHFQALERQVGLHDLQLSEMDLQFQILETATYDGNLLWKIKDYTRRKREAKDGKSLSLYSQPFYTSRHGYKMCARVYLNGDGMGKGTHLSLFFVVMRGEYDQLLPWPFAQKVTLQILDQERRQRHLQDAFRPDKDSSSFRRPTSEMNIASGCPRFVSHEVLENGDTYIKNDSLFIKIRIDTVGLDPP